MADPTRAEMIAALKAQSPTGDSSGDAPSRADMIAALKSGQINSPKDRSADISSVVDDLSGNRAFGDSGRSPNNPGERLDAYIGAPVRSGLMSLAKGDSAIDALKAGANQMGKDPQSAPTGFDVANKMDIQNPYLGAAVATGADLAQLPVMEVPVAGARFLREAAPTMAEGVRAGTQAAGEMASSFGKKFGKVFASVPEETTARYLENPSVINQAAPRDQIADQILSHKKIAEEQLDKAHEELSNAKAAVAENKTDVRSGIQDQKFQARNDQSEAQAALNEKKQGFKEALKSNSLTSMAGDVSQAVGDLKDQVVKGSSDAYDILGKSNARVNTDPLREHLQNTIDGMRINGVYESPEAEKAAGELQGWQKRLFDMTKGSEGALSGPQAKQVMQAVDKITSYSKQAGTFSPETERALKGMRSIIDRDVKAQVPSYASQMGDVSRKAELLSKSNDLYGSPDKAISNLNNIDSEKGKALHVPIIAQLSKETGKDLSPSVENYLLNQKILSTPSFFDKAIDQLPEARALRKTQNASAKLSDPEYLRGLLADSSKPLEEKASSAATAKESAQQKKDLFSGITPDSVTAKTKALGGANDYGAKERFGNIDKALGTDFEKQIQARNDADQFTKTDTHGSRKTILGTVLGLAGGAMMDHPVMGAEVGGMAGHTLDKYSGQVYKAMLDRGMSVAQAGKAVSEHLVKVLSKPEVLDAVAKKSPAAIDKAVLAALSDRGARMSNVASNDQDKSVPDKGPTKWANDGLNKLISHSGDQSLADKKSKMLEDRKTRDLLIAASDLNPGSKAMEKIHKQIKSQDEDKK